MKSKVLEIMFKFSVCWLWHFTKQVISSSEASLYFCEKTNCHFISLLLTISNQNSRQKAGKIFFKIWVKCFYLTSELFLDTLNFVKLDIESSFVANIMKLNIVWRKWFSNIFLCLDSEVFIDPKWEFPCQEKMLKVYDLSYSCI